MPCLCSTVSAGAALSELENLLPRWLTLCADESRCWLLVPRCLGLSTGQFRLLHGMVARFQEGVSQETGSGSWYQKLVVSKEKLNRPSAIVSCRAGTEPRFKGRGHSPISWREERQSALGAMFQNHHTPPLDCESHGPTDMAWTCSVNGFIPGPNCLHRTSPSQPAICTMVGGWGGGWRQTSRPHQLAKGLRPKGNEA